MEQAYKKVESGPAVCASPGIRGLLQLTITA